MNNLNYYEVKLEDLEDRLFIFLLYSLFLHPIVSALIGPLRDFYMKQIKGQDPLST